MSVPALKPLALALTLSTVPALPAFAQSDTKTLSPVIVSASRFASDTAATPIGASIITAEEIREAGVGNVNEAVRRLGGVYGRQSLRGTPDFSLDLRGFGTNSDQNLVVIIDGVRLTEGELSPALLSSIPIESVERVEIVRGGSSVLYGEGATGGTIHVITKRGTQGLRGSLVGEIGSYGHREVRGYAGQSWGKMSADASLTARRADNFRDNNDVKQQNLSAGLQWALEGGRAGFRVDAGRQDSRFAGSLNFAQYQQNPRQTTTPNDFGSLDTDRYTAFFERRMGEFEVAAELAHRERESDSLLMFGGLPFASRSEGSMTQFSPRIRHTSNIGGHANELVLGVDLTRWDRHTVSRFGAAPFSNADARQKSRAVYARDEIRIGNGRIAVGARHEVFNKDFSDPLNFFGSTAYTRRHSLNAWDVTGKYDITPTLHVFGKVGRSYRVANADENASTPVPNRPLEPQTSQDLEVGIKVGDAQRSLTARVFRHRLANEIFYSPLVFANVNLDPTQREGIELEGNVRLMTSFMLAATIQHVKAEFRGGPNAGNEMVLVPRNTATLRLNWMPGNAHSGYVGLQWTDSQRYGGDFTNACGVRIPSFATVDARYAYRSGPWELALTGVNLGDRRYFTNAFGACRSGIYPDAGRQIKASVRYDF